MCQLAGWSRQACNLGRKQTLHLACESKLPENCQQWLVSVITIRAFFILSKNRAWNILCYMKVSSKVLLKHSFVPLSLGGVLAKTHGHSTYFCLIPKPGTTQWSWGLVKRFLEKLISLWLTRDMQGENTLRLEWFAAGASWGIDWASVSSSTVLDGLTRWKYSEGTGWLAEEGGSLETVDWKLVFSQSLSPRRW